MGYLTMVYTKIMRIIKSQILLSLVQIWVIPRNAEKQTMRSSKNNCNSFTYILLSFCKGFFYMDKLTLY